MKLWMQGRAVVLGSLVSLGGLTETARAQATQVFTCKKDIRWKAGGAELFGVPCAGMGERSSSIVAAAEIMKKKHCSHVGATVIRLYVSGGVSSKQPPLVVQCAN